MLLLSVSVVELFLLGFKTITFQLTVKDLLNTVSLFCFRVDAPQIVTEPATETKPEPATETKPEPEIVQTEVRRTFCCGFYLPLIIKETRARFKAYSQQGH